MTFYVPEEWVWPLCVTGGVLLWVLCGLATAAAVARLLGVKRGEPGDEPDAGYIPVFVAFLLPPVAVAVGLFLLCGCVVIRLTVPKDKG